jgi:orotate phosphoribosyltransferase
MHSDLALRIHAASHLIGQFTLRSGRTATEYFDKYRFEADPVLLDEIARRMASLVPSGTEVLAGLEMGGIPVVTALGRHTGLPCAFVRKQAKPYGTCRLAEGAEVAGRRVLVVEDVVTSGGQIVLSTADLRGLGAQVGRGSVRDRPGAGGCRCPQDRRHQPVVVADGQRPAGCCPVRTVGRVRSTTLGGLTGA